MKKQCKVGFCHFPGDLVLRPQSAEWMQRTMMACRPVKNLGAINRRGAHIERWECDHEHISEIVYYRRTDTPIDMVRNDAVATAQDFGVDFLLMLDNDMEPDQPGPHSVLFWQTAFPWMFKRLCAAGVKGAGDPTIVFAPYLHGQGSINNVMVFKWEALNNHVPRVNFQAKAFDREEAAARGGFERVAMGPTGLMLIDMRVFSRLGHPYFQYEWEEDGPKCRLCGLAEPGERRHKASTEDCYFTREVSLAWGDDPQFPEAGCYCLWDSWAIHHKVCGIERPESITNDQVSRGLRLAVEKRRSSKESVHEAVPDPRMPPAKRVIRLTDPPNGQHIDEPVAKLESAGPFTRAIVSKKSGRKRR